jgi:hypothetical protein
MVTPLDRSGGRSVQARSNHLGRVDTRQNAGRLPPTEGTMAKGIQHDKMTKKPKKDTGPGKAAGSDRPVAPMTAVMPKGKLKNKPG